MELVDVYFKWSIVYDDQDDDKFVDCALNGNANLLVTDDRHFAALDAVEFPSVRVMRTAAFVDFLKGEGAR